MNPHPEAFFEAVCLTINPFDGDFGEPGDHVFTDKFVSVRKPGPCAFCNRSIEQGQRARAMSAKFDGSLFSYRWCRACCVSLCNGGTSELAESEPNEVFSLDQARAALRFEQACGDENVCDVNNIPDVPSAMMLQLVALGWAEHIDGTLYEMTDRLSQILGGLGMVIEELDSPKAKP